MAACACGAAPVLPKTIKREILEELTQQTKLNASEVKALYRRFRLLAGQSGCMLPEQFRQTMGVLGLTDDPFLPERMFMVFDINQDGKLSFFEFASSLAVMLRGTEEEKLKLSFEMTAGKHDASGISFDNFQHLIKASNTMMMSLVTPDVLPADDDQIRKMFDDLASDASGDEAVITLDDYTRAAQTNDDFLMALGLSTAGPGRGRKTERRTARATETATDRSVLPTSAMVIPQDHCLISISEIDELRERVATLREVVLQDNLGSGKGLESGTSLPSNHSGPVTVVGDVTDPDERWWTPLPKKNRHLTNSKGIDVQIDVGLETIDDVVGEFDKVLGWCNHATEAGVNGHSRPHAVSSAARPERSSSKDSDSSPERRGSAGSAASSSAGPRVSCQTFTEERSTSRNRSQSASRKSSRKRHRLLGPKKGLAVHFGHENWNMVLSMMIGIRMSVGRIKHEMNRELTPVDFIMKEKFSIIPRMANIFDSEVSKRVTMTRFIDYAPLVFHRIRTSFGINSDDYLKSVGPEQLLGNMVLGNLSSLSELSSEGKSGAFFYYTSDGKYMMKTVAPKEQQLLKRMLKRYYDHITRNNGTLVCRFLGLHCLRVRKVSKGRLDADKRLHFVVMANMFNAPFEIHRRFDLKGSWVGRLTKEAHLADASVALKDVDFQQANESINVGPDVKEKLMKQIESDSAFLRDNNIIDYSLLLGIHDVGAVRSEDSEEDEFKAVVQIQEVDTMEGQAYVSPCFSPSVARSSVNTTVTWPGSPSSAFAAGSAEIPVHQRDLGGLLSADKKQLYFFGIIDILTPYDTMKKLEHHFKALRNERRGVSCCPPVFYSERFNDFMRNSTFI